MAKPRNTKHRLAGRRGVFPDDVYTNSWGVTLIQVPGRAGPVDLNELLVRLAERGAIGASRRDVGADLHAGKVPTPAGDWGLLVALPGQAWAYLVPGFTASDAAPDFAKAAGVRVIDAGFDDTSNATGFLCVEGDDVLAKFESTGLGGDVVDEYRDGDPDGWRQTLFRGTRLPKDWVDSFESPAEVLDALAKEFDAFIPYLSASRVEGTVSINGFDRSEFERGDYLRIDLVGFGGARLEPSAADHRLLAAILDGDEVGVRSAAAAGADLRRLPGRNTTALNLAVRLSRDGKPWRDLIATLLELGAALTEPGHEPPVHTALDSFTVRTQGPLIEVLELLTGRGADVDAPGLDVLAAGVTPLHRAARLGWLAVVKYLVAKGADVRALNILGHTPRQEAEAGAKALTLGIPNAETAARYAAVIAFLADAEAGRADLDWSADV
jgi:hypothetical protein